MLSTFFLVIMRQNQWPLCHRADGKHIVIQGAALLTLGGRGQGRPYRWLSPSKMVGTLHFNFCSQTCLLWDPQVYPPFPKCWLWIFNCIVSKISIQNTICSQFWVGTWLLSCLLVKDGSKTGLNAVHGTHMKDKNLQLKRLLKCFFHQMLTASLPFPRSPLFMALSAVRLWVLKCGWLVRNRTQSSQGCLQTSGL